MQGGYSVQINELRGKDNKGSEEVNVGDSAALRRNGGVVINVETWHAASHGCKR